MENIVYKVITEITRPKVRQVKIRIKDIEEMA